MPQPDLPELSQADVAALADAPFDPHAAPKYEAVKGCLVWADELPDVLSSGGRRFVYRLLAARSYLYRAIPLNGRLGYLGDHWQRALTSGMKWNGFLRLQLSDQDRVFLDEEMRRERDEGLI
jgi:hypothetical protein